MASIPRSPRGRRVRKPLRRLVASVETVPEAPVASANEAAAPVAGQPGLRRISRTRARGERQTAAAEFPGFPTMQGLRPVFSFLFFPILIVMALALTGGNWPPMVLYPLAFLMGAYVAWFTLSSLELVVACMIFYFPFSTSYAISIMPGVNGTNMLLLLALGGALMQVYNGSGLFRWLPGTILIFLFALLSSLSGVTTLALPGGYEYIRFDELLNYKGWIEQFVFVFILYCSIRDHETAKRMVIYMCLASMALVIYVIPEMLEKMGRSSIEKSRLEGPHSQSNNFGGFVAYSLMPLLALFMVYMNNIKVWVLSPYFLLVAKVLITTFSRGAYLAMALGAFFAAYFRGKGFLLFWATVGISFLLVFPQLIPGSILDRMQTLTSQNHNAGMREEQLDTSSQVRLILWRAAARMAIEDPITGKGFKAFPLLKSSYTDIQVEESDPHNMYLSIAAEMGLPTLSVFLVMLLYAYIMGVKLTRNRADPFTRAVGIGGAAAVACYAVICLFGSRAVNLEFSAYFWSLFVIMQVLSTDPSVLAGDDKTLIRDRDLPPGAFAPGRRLQKLLRERKKRQAKDPKPMLTHVKKRRTNAFEAMRDKESDS